MIKTIKHTITLELTLNKQQMMPVVPDKIHKRLWAQIAWQTSHESQ